MAGQPNLALKRRTCFNCKRRKIHCDKQEQCSRCIQDKVVCTYPVLVVPKRKIKPTRSLASLTQRLEHLEQVLSLASDGLLSPSTSASTLSPVAQISSSFDHQDSCHFPFPPITPTYAGNNSQPTVKTENQAYDKRPTTGRHPSQTGTGFIEQLLFQSHQPSQQTTGNIELAASQRHELWSIFTENFDPLIKVLHKPTTRRLFDIETVASSSPPSPESLALANAICLAAVTSLDDGECYSRFSHSRASLLSLYKTATEAALVQAELLTTPNLEVHQAFIIYICSVATHCSVSLVCTMARMAINLARFHGFHRDGVALGLSPFETEMRRRLWWSLVCVDFRYSEESEFSTVFAVYLDDAQLPLNINDQELDQDMTTSPPSRKGFTDMSLSLIRIEMAFTWQQVRLLGCVQRYQTQTQTQTRDAEMVRTRYRLLRDCEDRIKNTYIYYGLAHASDEQLFLNQPTTTINHRNISQASIAMFQFVGGKLRNLVSAASGSESAYKKQNDPDWTIASAIQVLELYIQLCQGDFTLGWKWFFRSYPLWHILINVLSHLCREQPDAYTHHAWQLIDALHNARLLTNLTFAGEKMANVIVKLRDQALYRRVQQSLART